MHIFFSYAGVWAYTWRVVKEYAQKYKHIHVTSGPVYDHNTDGLADTRFSPKTV